MSDTESEKNSLQIEIARTKNNFSDIMGWLIERGIHGHGVEMTVMQVAAAIDTEELDNLKAVFDAFLETPDSCNLYSYGGCMLAALEIVKKNRTNSLSTKKDTLIDDIKSGVKEKLNHRK